MRFGVLVTCSATLSKRALGANWYDGVFGLHLMFPEDEHVQEHADALWQSQIGRTGMQFTDQRQAILLLPGVYPEDFDLNIGYYTSVAGVGRTPHDVILRSVGAFNEENGHATENFWRSFEGVELTGESITWAVSQGAAVRRSTIRGDLHLSQDAGWASGGFLADSKVLGQVVTGTQQQWFFRNSHLPGGIDCSAGWNYVFVGMSGMAQDVYDACGAREPGLVTAIEETPRVASKPYLVFDESKWWIYVPEYIDTGSVGVDHDLIAASARKINLDDEVFVAKPEHSAQDINEGIKGKQGILVTPGIYTLWDPIEIVADGFVVLGIGFPTLISVTGRAAIQVAGGVSDVRIASVLLEAGTPSSHGETEPLLRWGEPDDSGSRPSDHQMPSGVLSDIFARVGSFNHTGCQTVRTDAMVEINSDDVVADNIWLWHADHDDCGTSLESYGPSDECHSGHGLVVNGDRVTTYGLAVEHANGGDMVSWTGEGGEVYFFQAELPYHNAYFGEADFKGFSVARHVQQHTMWGIGVYIIGELVTVQSAIQIPPSAQVTNLVTVVIEGTPEQFSNIVCVAGADDGPQDYCAKPESCGAGNRCWLRYLGPEHPSGDIAVPDQANGDAGYEGLLVAHQRFPSAPQGSSLRSGAPAGALPAHPREQETGPPGSQAVLRRAGRAGLAAGCVLFFALAVATGFAAFRRRFDLHAGRQPVLSAESQQE